MATGAGPAHALYFACYEKIKHVASGGKQGNHLAVGKFLALTRLKCVSKNHSKLGVSSRLYGMF